MTATAENPTDIVQHIVDELEGYRDYLNERRTKNMNDNDLDQLQRTVAQIWGVETCIMLVRDTRVSPALALGKQEARA